MSRIKYIYYINNVSKDKDNALAKWNNVILHNTTETIIGIVHSLELLIKELQSIFTF
jgi:hypothetical protein